MPSETTLARLTRILRHDLGIAVDTEIRESDDIIEDLGADSLDVVELTIAAEDEFLIEIRESDTENVRTVADAVALIDRLVAGKEEE